MGTFVNNNSNGIYSSFGNTFTKVLKNSKANKPKLIIDKLNETYSKVGIELNCTFYGLYRDYFLFFLDMCDDRPIYKVNINELGCVREVEHIGFIDSEDELNK